MNHTRLWRAVLTALTAAWLVCCVCGCAGREKEDTQVVSPGVAAAAGSGKDAPDDTEAETAFSTEEMEEMTEMLTEEMDFRSIREVFDEETLAWAESFSAENVDRMVYTILGEARTEYEVKEPEKIVSFYVAIMDLTVGGRTDTFIQDAGDTYEFYSKDGNVTRFEFNMGCYVTDGKIYETDHSDRLWELTGELIPPEDL